MFPNQLTVGYRVVTPLCHPHPTLLSAVRFVVGPRSLRHNDETIGYSQVS